MSASKPHSEPEHTTHFHDASERARELLAFEGEPKVIGQWFAEARYMARAYLGLVEQLEAKQKRLNWYEGLQGDANDADFDSLVREMWKTGDIYPARNPDA